MPSRTDLFYNNRLYKLISNSSIYSNELLQQLNSLLHEEPELAGLFQNLVLNEGSEIDVRVNAIEGLAYASLKPTVKEMIAHHPTLLKEIFKLVKEQEKLNIFILF